MKCTSFLLGIQVFLGIQAIACSSAADIFGSGANTFEIEFVTVGNPGNPADANPNPAGAVPYSYRIGKYEVSEQMIDKANALGALGITKDTRGPDKPATSVTWYEAAQLVNWLNTSTGGTPAYKFDGFGNFQLWEVGDPGYNPNNLYRNRRARYFLPSINEWHKAAYYDPVAGVYHDYPTGSDSVPDGIDFVGDPVFDAVFYDGGRILGKLKGVRTIIKIVLTPFFYDYDASWCSKANTKVQYACSTRPTGTKAARRSSSAPSAPHSTAKSAATSWLKSEHITIEDCDVALPCYGKPSHLLRLFSA